MPRKKEQTQEQEKQKVQLANETLVKKDAEKRTKDEASAERRKFCITQIQNTKKIINSFSKNKELSLTVLLNSLLSLVVLPCEDSKVKDGERIFPGSMQNIMKNFGFTPDIFAPIKKCTNGKVERCNRTIYVYINKLRNAVAHQNIIIDVDKDRSIHITLFNIYNYCKGCKSLDCIKEGWRRQGGGVCDFQITVTLGQLKKLAMYIADSYLKAIGGR